MIGMQVSPKRRKGLFKQASELCTSCKADVGMIIFSPTNKAHSFFHPNMEKVANSFLKKEQPTNSADSLVEALEAQRIEKLNQQLDEVEVQKEKEEARAKKLDALSAKYGNNDWLPKPIDEMNMEEVVFFKSWVADLIVQLENHSIALENGASASNLPPN